MTERYDILNIIEKALLNNPDLFGELQKGSLNDPSVLWKVFIISLRMYQASH